VREDRISSGPSGQLPQKRSLEAQTASELRRSLEEPNARVRREGASVDSGCEHAHLDRQRGQGRDLRDGRGQGRVAGVDLLGDEDDSCDSAKPS